MSDAMFAKIFGDISFWQQPRSLSPRQWLRVLLLAALPSLYMFRRLLSPGYQFIGNDSDMLPWAFQFRFVRLWLAAGSEPWWNPFLQLGTPNQQGPTQPYSLLSLLQRAFSSVDNGLDHSLFALSLLLVLSSVALLIRLRFSPMASLLGGLLLAGTGSAVTQLFAGHVALYSSFCLISLIALSLLEGLRRSKITALLPAALSVAALLACGETQGPYLVLWTVGFFFLARALLGSPDMVPAPTLWTAIPPQSRPGSLLAPVDLKTRLREASWTLCKLWLVFLVGALLSTVVWYPSLCSGADPGLDGPVSDIFAHSAAPLVWLTVLVPHFFLGSGETYNWAGWAQWEGQPGTGVLSFLIILLGLALRRQRDLWLPGSLLLAASLLACGKYTPIFGWYAKIDPWIGRFEVPSRIYLAVNFASMMLVAWGIDSLNQCQWRLSPTVQTALRRTAAGLLGVWLIGYFLDGSFELWQLFARHVQFGYLYGGTEPVDALEYYVLSWTRFSAVTAMVCLAAYILVRLPEGWRAPSLGLLLAVEICRFNHPYANLRPNGEFQLPEQVANTLTEQKITGKVLNSLLPRSVGAFGLLRFGEWAPDWSWLDPQSSRLWTCADHVFKKDKPAGSLAHPGLFNRFAGVQAYFHAKGLLDDKVISPLYADTTTFASKDGDWAVSKDSLARPPVYVSRQTQPVAHPYRMLQQLHQDPARLSRSVNFVDPATHQFIIRAVRERKWTRPGGVAQDSTWVVQRLPNLLEVGCEVQAPALLIVNEAWSPDWSCWVDGQEQPCLPCQMGYNRGVLVDTGRHQIRFLYAPQAAAWARRRSWVTFVGCALFGLFFWGVPLIGKRLTEGSDG
jgi:hypothetical protein